MVRIHSIDQDAFSEITTEKAAYCLGFILADGYRMSKGKGVCIDVKPSDEPVIHYIREHCKSSAPIFHRVRNHGYAKGGVSVGVNITSVKLASDLEKLGVIKNKSAGTKLPSISRELTRHMVRGYFDGNGCLTTRQFFITAHETVCADIIRIGLDIDIHLSSAPMGNICRIWGGRKNRRFVDWMYENCEFALPRKLELYDLHWRSLGARGAIIVSSSPSR